ncbi:unnamed protein product, partial [Porites lobata]
LNFPGVQVWTKDHDLLLCREVLSVNPYSAKKNSNERGRLWDRISANLNSTSDVYFSVTKRSVRDHIAVLIKKYKKKMKDEEKASGINPEPTELEQALAEIIEMEEAAETEHQDGDGRRKEKDEADKHKAESMRKLAMEKLGETQKRAVEEGEQDCQKKKRRSGNDTIEYLREKSESDKVLKEEELSLKRKQQELEEKKLTSFLDQQKSMMQLMQEQQQQQQVQTNNIQMMMMQQSQAFMAVLDKLTNKMG